MWKLVEDNAYRLRETKKTAVSEWLQKGNRGKADTIALAVWKRRADVETALRQLVAEGLADVGKTSHGRG